MELDKRNYFFLSNQEVSSFIDIYDHLFGGKLVNYYNYSRVVSLAYFNKLAQQFKLIDIARVAIVSGSKNEPELLLLNPRVTDILSFEDEPQKFDLEKPWSKNEAYDLVMCNQALEHISNPRLALSNLANLTRPGGYIYISVPTINGIHGEPFFYSSGYHPRFIERIANELRLEPLHVGSWGSKKYLLNAVLNNWLSTSKLGSFGICRSRIKFSLPILFWADGKKNDPRFITDCWALLRKA